MDKFIKAKQIWGKKYLNEMNISLFFVEELAAGDYKFRIAANNFYRVFLNGKLLYYGPSRSAHGFFEIDQHKIKCNDCLNRIVIEVVGYQTNTYYSLNTKPFVCYEIASDNKILKYSSENTKCYLNKMRYQKVSRFSYQRPFSESYNIKFKEYQFLELNNLALEEEEVISFKYGTFLQRIPHSANLNKQEFKFAECGFFMINDKLSEYQDRYMYTQHLSIFDKKDYEVNPNYVASKAEYHIRQGINLNLKKGDFVTFKNDYSLTGFVFTNIEVLEDSECMILFDEINLNSNENELIQINCFRNTTHNVIYYKLEKGKYNLISFEPYTAKFIRILAVNGNIKINNLGIIRYENPDCEQFKYNFYDSKINEIMFAGINTFKQNAVDILTDCPSRERAGWLCDSYFSAKAEQFLTGRNIVEKNFLNNYRIMDRLETLPDGMIPCCYPAEHPDGMFIPNWAMFYVLELKDYLIRSGDVDLVKGSEKKILGLIEYFESFENEYGFLENLENWVFVEWSKANDFVEGVNFPSNMLYSKFLLTCGEILCRNDLKNKALELNKKIIDFAFDGNFFHDNALRDKNNNLQLTDNISETCQYFAYYFGTISKNSFPELRNKLINSFGPNRNSNIVYKNVFKSNVFIGDYLRLSLLNDWGKCEQVFAESIDYFYKMSKLTGTLWEHDSSFASLNHAFASYIINLIIEANCGLKCIDNFNNNIIFNSNALLNDMLIKIPLIDGFLEVVISNKKMQINCTNDKYKIIKL